MKRSEIFDWLNNSEDGYDYGKHEFLVSLTCVFEDDEGDTEITFAVPVTWLIRVMEFSDEMYLHSWLMNEYTSDDSQYVLERAIQENKIAFWRIN